MCFDSLHARHEQANLDVIRNPLGETIILVIAVILMGYPRTAERTMKIKIIRAGIIILVIKKGR